MAFSTLIQNIKNMIARRSKPPEDIDDDLTTDKYLRSLRRQRRLQMEELEKKMLIKKIAAYEKERTKRNLYGKLTKQGNLLKKQKSMLITKKRPLGGKYKF